MHYPMDVFNCHEISPKPHCIWPMEMRLNEAGLFLKCASKLASELWTVGGMGCRGYVQVILRHRITMRHIGHVREHRLLY